MRIESQIKIKVKEKIIGGPQPLICLPLVAGSQAELLDEADQLASMNPDLIEWRVDHYADHHDPRAVLAALAVLRERTGDIPLLFTCRSAAEGGNSRLTTDQCLQVNLAAAASGMIEILDTEISNGAAFILQIKTACKGSAVKLLLSYHNFDHTPELDVLVQRLTQAQELGAHIAKIAVMPKTPGDVLTLLNAAYTARAGSVRIPIAAISMGELGAISRIAGGEFGSDITFAVGRKRSAPGQVPIKDLRCFWEMMQS